ncbi:hypothetical protein VSDG_02128 [Cytospora chrysosperma]|uniref:DUF985 domain-containing protein n=1 Tax=Cytospora chrysosperma TaxID=252740 RepID=A0A423WEC5_CYTCH|nr:hypothetical protein VSDG_02128 [Valsa sordida]
MPLPTRYSIPFLGLLALLVGPDAVSSRPGSTDIQIRQSIPVDERPAQDIIDKLNLIPNEEKGYYIQSFEDNYTIPCLNRSASTAIYYLLEGTDGESIWHRVDAVEVWHYYAGAPLVLSLSYDNGQPWRNLTLGPDIFDNQQPQVAIEKGEWQQARSLGNWTLVGTTVAPGFTPSGVELADPGWTPTGS